MTPDTFIERRRSNIRHERVSDRFISNLTKNTVAIILAGGRGSRLKNLTDWRAKPAVQFGGKFRIIDFPTVLTLEYDVLTSLRSIKRKA